jgi:cytochrome c oxidase subunit II
VNAGSVLQPFGPQSARIADLWWAMFIVAAIVCVAVYVALAWASLRHRRARSATLPTPVTSPQNERQIGRIVVGAVAITAVTLIGFLIADFRTGRAMTTRPDEEPLVIEVIGHQWWWELNYSDSVASRRVTTANELHVPVGRPVVLQMTSRDVIHSIWVPNLMGKRDLVPGHGSSLWFRADSAGVYGGQCAEFCGHQHAKMSLLVIAEPEPQFAAWYNHQLESQPPPSDAVLKRGQDVFVRTACALCHTIGGTPAGGRNGPNLTHLATRRTIAAGTVPNTRGHLAGWIIDPQGIKPGVKMPSNQIPSTDLDALLTYLESLK